MELSKFCPRCGKEAELYGDEKKLCSECYTDVHDLADLPDKKVLTVCPVCGRMKKSGEYVEAYSVQDQLLEAFSDLPEGVEAELQFWEEDDTLKVRVHLFKGEMEDFKDVEVEYEEEKCEPCERFDKGFYRAKIQLRGDVDEASRFVVDRAAELSNEDRDNFLANVVERDGGFDYLVSTQEMLRKILKGLRERFDPEVEMSYEQIGMKDGQEMHRAVASVRV